jgi:hypothetical protein
MILPTTGILGLALGKYSSSDYGSFLFLSTSGGPVTGYIGIPGGTGVPIFSERSSSLLLNGSGVPSSSIGYSGDYYINSSSSTYNMYGPKPSTTGAWLTGVGQYLPLSVSGATGLAGATGPSGASGQGVPNSGASGHILVKSSATSFATEWGDAVDILAKTKKLEMGGYSAAGYNLSLRDYNATAIAQLGSSITYNEDNGYFYLVSDSAKIIYEYTSTFEYSTEYAITFIDGVAKGIQWIKGDEFLISTYDGVNSPKVHKVVLYEETGTQSQLYDTLLPVTVEISGVTYDERNDKVYLSQKSSVSSVWNVWVVDKYTMLSAPTQFFNVQSSALNGGAEGTMSIHDIIYNKKNNTVILFMTSNSNAPWFYEIDVKTGVAVNESSADIDDPSRPNGLSYLYLDATYFGGSYSMGGCFKDDFNYFYASSAASLASYVVIASKSNLPSLVYDPSSDKTNLHHNGVFSPIEMKTYQNLNFITKTQNDVSNNFSDAGFGDVYASAFVQGSEVNVECFGVLSTYKTTSIFPKNYGSSTPTSLDLNYLTGNYYLSLPSGLSNVPWKYSSKHLICLSSGDYVQSKKSLYAHFEVFGSSKLDLFYTETGICNRTNYVAMDLALTFASGGSGVVKLYGQTIVQR